MLSSEVIHATGHAVSDNWTVLIPSNAETGELGFRVRLCAKCGEAVEYGYFLAGDINGDGKYSSKDLSYLKKYMAGNAPEDAVEASCDLTGDGKCTSADLKALKKLLSN